MTIGIIKSFHSTYRPWKIKDVVSQLRTWKYSIFIAATLGMIYARLSAMNFEKPQFKSMDNPLAASDDFATRVKYKMYWIFESIN